MTKWLFFFFSRCTNTPRSHHRFTMTITSAQRNHGNIELINCRTEELLVRGVHAASLCVRVKLTLGLQRFVCDVLGYINLLVSYGPPAPYPTITNPSLVHGCVRACECVCVFLRASVDIFPAFPRERRQRKSEKVFPRSLWRSQICHVCSTFSFFFNTSSKKMSPLSLHPLPFSSSSSSCHIVCAEADQFPLFVRRWELSKCSPLPLS